MRKTPTKVIRLDLFCYVLATTGCFWAYMDLERLWRFAVLAQALGIFFFACAWYFITMGVLLLNRVRITRRTPVSEPRA